MSRTADIQYPDLAYPTFWLFTVAGLAMVVFGSWGGC